MPNPDYIPAERSPTPRWPSNYLARPSRCCAVLRWWGGKWKDAMQPLHLLNGRPDRSSSVSRWLGGWHQQHHELNHQPPCPFLGDYGIGCLHWRADQGRDGDCRVTMTANMTGHRFKVDGVAASSTAIPTLPWRRRTGGEQLHIKLYLILPNGDYYYYSFSRIMKLYFYAPLLILY